MISQFVGGIAVVLFSSRVFGMIIVHPTVNRVTTAPGPDGPRIAFLAELIISFILMFMILTASNNQKIARLAGIFAGILVATYISSACIITSLDTVSPVRSGLLIINSDFLALGQLSKRALSFTMGHGAIQGQEV